MRGVRAVRTGGPEVLEFFDVAEPAPAAAEVLLEVAATALNRADLLQRQGLYPPPQGTSDVLGLECAGTVIAVGADVAPRWLGQRVMTLLPGGGYAERVAVPERLLMRVPANLSLEGAAAIPEAFLTAHEALFALGQVTPGSRVLIHAAAGGVGSAAVQLAAAAGAHVFATAGTDDKCRLVTTLGAHCFNHRDTDFAAELERVAGSACLDVIVDFIGHAYFERHCRLLAPRGRLVCVGHLSGPCAELDLGLLIQKRLQVLGLVMRSCSMPEKIAITQRFTREMLPRFESGQLAPVVDCVLPWSQVQAAHARMESNAHAGKIVLRVQN